MSAENIQPREFDKNKHWRDQINCANTDTEVFFSNSQEVGRETYTKHTREAKQKCVECIAKVACYEFSRQVAATDGIWGGLTKEQRRARRRQTKRFTEPALRALIEKDLQ